MSLSSAHTPTKPNSPSWIQSNLTQNQTRPVSLKSYSIHNLLNV